MALHGGRGACCSLNRPERNGAARRPGCLLLVEQAGEGWRCTEAEVPKQRLGDGQDDEEDEEG